MNQDKGRDWQPCAICSTPRKCTNINVNEGCSQQESSEPINNANCIHHDTIPEIVSSSHATTHENDFRSPKSFPNSHTECQLDESESYRLPSCKEYNKRKGNVDQVISSYLLI